MEFEFAMMEYVRPMPIIPQATSDVGKMAGLLTYPGSSRLPSPNRPVAFEKSLPDDLRQVGITAAGTVGDSHLVPY